MVTHVCGDVWIRAGSCCRHYCFAFSQCPALLLLAGLPCSRFGRCVWFTVQHSAEWEQFWGWEEEVWGGMDIQSYWMQFMGSLCGEVVISQHDWCWTTSDCAVVKLHFFLPKIFMAIYVLLQERNLTFWCERKYIPKEGEEQGQLIWLHTC